ncbi:MAG: glucose-6-phosphate isomerase, partial [Proteobacteria bacterium]|nr:glucose-6-phosphate isomerase [Pseudomonadota bacterium]
RRLALRARDWRAPALADALVMDPERRTRMVAKMPGLRLDFARQALDEAVIGELVALAQERDLEGWRGALLAGEPVNNTEQRAAWHSALRAGKSAPPEVRETLARMRTLAARVRGDGRIRRIVNLGTGGSDLGPRLLADALGDGALDARFAANVDPRDLQRALEGADPASTLVVVVSKTFTTQETMENARAAKAWAGRGGQFIAVSANEGAARSFGASEVLPMWDWVGGRFSLWSAAGISAMCAIGPDRFDALLAGAHEVDTHFADAPLEQNLPVLLGLLGVWNVNFLGAATHAVLPYANALRLLPSYLQQLEMESNGKQVDRTGQATDYATAPVVWGAEGTVGQHSFHQLLHQGTQSVPCDFIVAEADADEDPCHAILRAHAEAQAETLACGHDAPGLPSARRHPGSRSSSTLSLERVDARGLGRLIALYEHKVFVQGIVWNLNSFDQWGVERGKQLAGELLAAAPRVPR